MNALLVQVVDSIGLWGRSKALGPLVALNAAKAESVKVSVIAI